MWKAKSSIKISFHVNFLISIYMSSSLYTYLHTYVSIHTYKYTTYIYMYIYTYIYALGTMTNFLRGVPRRIFQIRHGTWSKTRINTVVSDGPDNEEGCHRQAIETRMLRCCGCTKATSCQEKIKIYTCMHACMHEYIPSCTHITLRTHKGQELPNISSLPEPQRDNRSERDSRTYLWQPSLSHGPPKYSVLIRGLDTVLRQIPRIYRSTPRKQFKTVPHDRNSSWYAQRDINVL